MTDNGLRSKYFTMSHHYVLFDYWKGFGGLGILAKGSSFLDKINQQIISSKNSNKCKIKIGKTQNMIYILNNADST